MKDMLNICKEIKYKLMEKIKGDVDFRFDTESGHYVFTIGQQCFNFRYAVIINVWALTHRHPLWIVDKIYCEYKDAVNRTFFKV